MIESQLLALYQTGHKYRRELLAMPLAQLAPILAHMTLRTSIRGKESVGELDTEVELRPYRTAKDSSDGTTIVLRELETFLGDVVKEFDPHLLAASVYGDPIATSPSETNIVRSVAMLMAQKSSNKLRTNLFTAKRNAKGDSTADLFNGFSTIVDRDIAAGLIEKSKGNLVDFAETLTRANIVDKLMELYQDAACEELQEVSTKMFLPTNLYNLYNRGYQDEFGSSPFNREFKKTFLEGSDDMCELVPMSGMRGTEQIQLTVRENMLIGCDQRSDEEIVRIRECDNPKVAQFFMKMYFGVEFESVSKQRLLVAKYKETAAEIAES